MVGYLFAMAASLLCVSANANSVRSSGSSFGGGGGIGRVSGLEEGIGEGWSAARDLMADGEVYPRHYVLWSAQAIRDKLLQWKTEYPDLVRVFTSQDRYGLPRSGNSKDCPFDEGGDGCLHYVMVIQDFVAHPEGSESANHLPEVLWSGSLHGNERVGPTAVMEAASLLLSAASCESKPESDAANSSPAAEARTCRNELSNRGISGHHRQWLARLVTTRRLVIVPTANALGYSRNQRTEEAIDPNRDFPYDVQDPQKCMQTIAGRTLNEVFREHMFQLSLTFHGGTEVIGYEWGAPSYLHKWSPDDQAQAEIAHAYSRFAGGWSGTRPYDVGTMNDKVYYVRGGMEDWAYAGSWDPDRVIPCEPHTYDPYPKEKTIYNNATLRVFNMLVETSNQKIPSESSLGTSQNVLRMDTEGNGHVSRNIRLALASDDLVEPYATIVGVNDLALSDDLIPLKTRSCKTVKKVMIPKNSQEATVEWTVGGALHVDETYLWFAKWDDIKNGTLDCLNQPSTKAVNETFKRAKPRGSTSGTGFFSPRGSDPLPSLSLTHEEPTAGPLFSATLDVSGFVSGDRIAVLAGARVDSAWTKQPAANLGPDVPPQAHVVNVRTNPDWKFESAGKHIKGRLYWFSLPVTIVIGDYDDSVGNQAGHEISTIEVSNRFGLTTGSTRGGVSPRKPKEKSETLPWSAFTGIVVGSIVVVALVVVLGRMKQAAVHRRVFDAYEEEGTSAADEDYIEESEGEFEGVMEMKTYPS